MVYATSAAEKGVPSEKLIPCRRLNVMLLPSLLTFHEAASSGSRCCVWRLRRTSTPPVRYRTVSEEFSSTNSGLNVFGSERRQKRNSPVDCATQARAAESTSNSSDGIFFMRVTPLQTR